MAKKTVITKEELDDKDTQTAAEENADDMPTPDEIELAEYFDSIGSTANKIKVYKWVEGERAYCGASEPSQMSEEFILKRWGGGKYALQALNNGRFVPGGNRTISLYQPEDAAPLQPHVDGGASDQITLLREQLQRQSEQMTSILTAIVTNRAEQTQETTSIKDLAAALRDLNDMQPKQAAPGEMMKPLLELMGKTMELAKDSATGDDNKMGWLKFAEQVLEKVPGMLEKVAPVIAARSGGNGDPRAAAAAMLQQGIGFLKEKALKHRDPGLYVDMILDNIEDPRYRPLLGVINQPFENFLRLDPELSTEPYKTFFESVYNGLIEGIKDAQNEDTAGPGGDSANVEPHGTVDGPGDTEPGGAPVS